MAILRRSLAEQQQIPIDPNVEECKEKLEAAIATLERCGGSRYLLTAKARWELEKELNKGDTEWCMHCADNVKTEIDEAGSETCSICNNTLSIGRSSKDVRIERLIKAHDFNKSEILHHFLVQNDLDAVEKTLENFQQALQAIGQMEYLAHEDTNLSFEKKT